MIYLIGDDTAYSFFEWIDNLDWAGVVKLLIWFLEADHLLSVVIISLPVMFVMKMCSSLESDKSYDAMNRLQSKFGINIKDVAP